MSADDPRSRLRGAVYRGDAVEILALLREIESLECLQLGGDGLLIALDQDLEGSPELGRQWVVLLRDRWWHGDDELADQLAARLGTGPTPMLRPLPVDLDQLSDVLEGDPMTGGGRVDLRSGEVWPQPVLEDAVESTRTTSSTPGGGCRCGPRVLGRATATCRTSSPRYPTRTAGTGWRSPSRVAGRFAGSKTYWLAGPRNSSAGTPSPKNANGAEPGPGSPRPGTACAHAPRGRHQAPHRDHAMAGCGRG